METKKEGRVRGKRGKERRERPNKEGVGAR